jgi:hypothetical protein
MTKPHRPKEPPGPLGPGLTRETYPALRAFVRGYLHQDFEALHGSIRAAARAFLADASTAERDQVIAELESLIRAVEGRSPQVLRELLADEMGSGWAPSSHDELIDLLDAMRSA